LEIAELKEVDMPMVFSFFIDETPSMDVEDLTGFLQEYKQRFPLINNNTLIHHRCSIALYYSLSRVSCF